MVGTALFCLFLIAGMAAALRARRRLQLEAAVSAAALLPFVVWLIHGSVDWFWEIPALSGPALGFLAMAAALGSRPPVALAPLDTRLGGDAVGGATPDPGPARSARPARPARARGRVTGALGVLAVLAAVMVLGFPYLSVRETSIASDIRQSDPGRALNTLSTAADLNPLSSIPGRLAGTIALGSQRYGVARARFAQVISRDPGGWYAWLGAGLAASALGDRDQARRDFRTAASMNPRNSVVARALEEVDTKRPLAPAAALQLLAAEL
jgi:tetratricopeptide (TPR) repeat protein